ncbi:uncharacterized protein [Spinacia oleracea]|uniref:Uncharacterized protein n=1 Tax=Spinacia oleracea TaxID=3562 RepID=A0ABM3QIT5_SPIOL|nr:uncharacterized protein LOC130459757 [Spinacia oleracea]
MSKSFSFRKFAELVHFARSPSLFSLSQYIFLLHTSPPEFITGQHLHRPASPSASITTAQLHHRLASTPDSQSLFVGRSSQLIFAGRSSQQQPESSCVLLCVISTGDELKTAREAVNYSLVESAVGAVTTAGVCWKYSKSPHGFHNSKGGALQQRGVG